MRKKGKKSEQQSVPMFKSIRLKNFKGFKDTGEIALKPLTVVIGKNNVGKSSLFQFMLALNQTLTQADNAVLVTSGLLVDLNAFNDIIHGKGNSDSTFSIAIKLNKPIDIGHNFEAWTNKSKHEKSKDKIGTDRYYTDELEIDFYFDKESNEIAVARSRMSYQNNRLFEYKDDKDGVQWKCLDLSNDTHPDATIARWNFIHTFPLAYNISKPENADTTEGMILGNKCNAWFFAASRP